LAPLDAFGLLDDYEAALFNRAFHHAPASVQAEIRALQASLADEANFLAVEEPRPLLRQKVLLAVTEAIEAAEEDLKPLATIGAGHGVVQALATRPVDAATTDAAADPMRELVAEIRSRASIPARERSAPYWRAAAFFLAAGLVVSLSSQLSTMRTAERIATLAQQELLRDDLRAMVPNLNDFLYGSSHIRSLTSSDTTVNAAATLYVDRDNRRALLMVLGLNASKGPFTLRSVDDRGNAEVIATFSTNQPVDGLFAENIPDVMLSRKLELLDGEGRVILRTA
jgi:hypothetical protein